MREKQRTILSWHCEGSVTNKAREFYGLIKRQARFPPSYEPPVDQTSHNNVTKLYFVKQVLPQCNDTESLFSSGTFLLRLMLKPRPCTTSSLASSSRPHAWDPAPKASWHKQGHFPHYNCMQWHSFVSVAEPLQILRPIRWSETESGPLQCIQPAHAVLQMRIVY